MALHELDDRVKLLINQQFPSENAAAKAFGIPQATLNRITSGQHRVPRISTLLRIAECCEVTLDWLIDGKGEGPDPFVQKRRRVADLERELADLKLELEWAK